MKFTIFTAIIGTFILKDAALWLLYLRTARPWLSPRGRRWAFAVAGAVFLLLNVPCVMLLASGGRYGFPPADAWLSLYNYTFYIWHFLGIGVLAAWGLGAAVLGLIGVARWSVSARIEPSPAAAAVVSEPSHPSLMARRDWLKASLMATPLLLTAGAVGAAVRQRGRFDIRFVDIAVANLPDALRGLTITHISDLHIGRMVDDDLLEPVVRAAAELGGEMIVVTGDIIDHNNTYLSASVDALSRLRAPLGVFCCMGNHDYIDDGAEVVRAIRSADLCGAGDKGMLVDDWVALRRRGREFVLGGIDWQRTDAGHVEHMQRTFDRAPTGVPRFLLAHHPHAWDAALQQDVSLTLAGHTHGGQIVLARGGQADLGGGTQGREQWSMGTPAFRYIEGLYSNAGRALYVSRGTGNWFPLRMKCPAELTLIRLV